MKKILRQTKTLLILLAIAFSGCTSAYDDLTMQIDGAGTSVSFSFDVASITSATEEDYSAATRATEESGIANMWIVQFDSDGDFVKSEYRADASSDDGLYTIMVDDSASQIIFLVNTFESDLITESTTLSSLNALTYDIAAHDDVLGSGESDKYCIMNGSVKVADLSTTETNKVSLMRNAVKVYVKIEDNLSGDEWEFLSIETLNIQDESYYIPGDYSESDTFPKTSSTVDYKWSSDEVTSGIGEDGLTFYLPINKRGTNQESTSKYEKTDYAPEDATAIKVNYYDKANPLKGASFTFYLGADMIDDYNLLGNHSYSYTFTINGIGVNDSRVAAAAYEFSDISTLLVFEESDISNCYILNPSNETQEFYIPIEGRINTFWGGQGYETEEGNVLFPGQEWYVDILWSDISDTSGFTAERVIRTSDTLTPGGNAIAGGSALKVTLPSSFNGNEDKYGNIVVGIRNTAKSDDADNYLWSWHFWITNYDPSGATSSTTGATSTDGATSVVTNGNVVRLPDSSDSNYAIWSGAYLGKWMMDRPIGAITNEPKDHTSNRGVLYYQYGRKDPFSLWLSGSYDSSTISSATGTSEGTVANGVLNPTKLDSNDGGVVKEDSDYQSLYYVWNDPKQEISVSQGDSASEVGGKSIFDPSPLGWKVPSRYTWYYMSGISGTINSSDCTGYFVSSQGAYIGEESETNSTSYFAWYPASGYIAHASGSHSGGGTNGYYCSCSPYSATVGYYLLFGSSSVYKSYNSRSRGNGFNIIPIQE